MMLGRVVVETGCEGLERVDRVVEARLGLSRIETYFGLLEFGVVEAEVVK